MAANAISDPIYMPDSPLRRVVIQPEIMSDRFLSFVNILQKSRSVPFVVAREGTDSPDKFVKKPDNEDGSDLDLRYVDWDLVKAGKKANGNNGKTEVKDGNNGDNGDNGDKNENDEEGDEKKDREEEEKDGGGGWDRLWDAAKLG